MADTDMADPYAAIPDETKAYADVLVNYSGDVGEDDLVLIQYEPAADELALAVQEKVLDAGGHPVVEQNDPRFGRGLFYAAEADQITHVPDYAVQKAREADVAYNLRAPENEAGMADVPSEKRQQRRMAQEPIREEIIGNTDWVLAQYWTPALAQKANMSTDAVRQFILDACVKDWEEEAAAYQELKEIVDDGEHVSITGENTALEFSIGERDGVNRVGEPSDGTNNVPGGEVFTAPVKETVNGHVYFDLPAFVQGTTVSGVYLEFEDGEVVEYSAESGEDVLEEIIETDDGAKYLGELGIGTNFAIDRPMKDTLFDEKIGGTIHLALGRAYGKNFAPALDPADIDHGLDDDRFTDLVETAEEHLGAGDDAAYNDFVNSLSNAERSAVAAYREAWEAAQAAIAEQQNQSAQHQDFVKDMRTPASDGTDSELRIDGEPVLRNGSFVGVDRLP